MRVPRAAACGEAGMGGIGVPFFDKDDTLFDRRRAREIVLGGIIRETGPQFAGIHPRYMRLCPGGSYEYGMRGAFPFNPCSIRRLC